MILYKKAIKAQTGLGTTASYPLGSQATAPTIHSEFFKRYVKRKPSKTGPGKDVKKMAYVDDPAGAVGFEINANKKKAKLEVVSNTLWKI